MIDQYGSFRGLPNAAVQPEKDLDYKIIFSITKEAKKKKGNNPGLVHVARLLNIYQWAGVPKDNLHVVAIVHSKATPIVVADKAFKKKLGYKNPDEDLIRQLKQAGVEIFICGQSLLGQGFQEDEVLPEITFALSALSVLPTYQLKGYALMRY